MKEILGLKKSDNRLGFEDGIYGTLSSDGNNFYIYGEIDDSFGEKIIMPFIKEMKKQKERRDGIMNIYINSPGGNLYQAMDFIALMEQCSNNYIVTKTIVPTRAASAASAIAVAGNIRLVGASAFHRIHNPRGEDFSASLKQSDNNNEYYKYLYNWSVNHYKKYTNLKDIVKKLEEDNYRILGGEILIKNGFADYLLEDSII